MLNVLYRLLFTVDTEHMLNKRVFGVMTRKDFFLSEESFKLYIGR
jgi:hypothetical protein